VTRFYSTTAEGKGKLALSGFGSSPMRQRCALRWCDGLAGSIQAAAIEILSGQSFHRGS